MPAPDEHQSRVVSAFSGLGSSRHFGDVVGPLSRRSRLGRLSCPLPSPSSDARLMMVLSRVPHRGWGTLQPPLDSTSRHGFEEIRKLRRFCSTQNSGGCTPRNSRHRRSTAWTSRAQPPLAAPSVSPIQGEPSQQIGNLHVPSAVPLLLFGSCKWQRFPAQGWQCRGIPQARDTPVLACCRRPTTRSFP